MSYQVLARKWRPRSFREMVGQEHVLKALINALDSQRLHHAYLFTGTRGVGKTTIARIMAKCLNCEQGVGSSPCGQCSICREIDEGRFVDLIEVDAASKTKVEDTRELLDNVQYMPSRGRYKVYLIDEVHMLSTSSFNALLKTLEEPPPHVKFLLATTDPQKLPATVLSRCLQFSLKNMPPEAIVGHLSHVLESENIAFEEQALWLLGRAADGSMRDAMSLTDQAVAFGEGRVVAEDVRAMLGTLEQGQVFGLLAALAEADAGAVLQGIVALAEQGPDWQSVLAEMLTVLHRTAVAQMLPQAIDNSHGDREQVLQLAQTLSGEDVQFYYQVALLGRRDLPLAPDPRDGFEMLLLRMLAFRPANLPGAPAGKLVLSDPGTAPSGNNGGQRTAPAAGSSQQATAQPQTATTQAAVQSATVSETAARPASSAGGGENSQAAAEPEPEPEPDPDPDPESVAEPAAAAESVPTTAVVQAEVAATPALEPESAPTPEDAAEPELPTSESDFDAQAEAGEYEPSADYAAYEYLAHMSADETEQTGADLKPHIPPASGAARRWIELYDKLDVSGMTANIARNCTLLEDAGTHWQLQLDRGQSALFNQVQQQRINDALNKLLGREITLEIEVAETTAETPALNLVRRRAQQQQQAEQSLEQDEMLQLIRHELEASICHNTVEPLNPI